MSEIDLVKNKPVKCWKCKKPLPLADRYCRYCGRGQGKYVNWYYRHIGIILLSLFALGPFALYFVIRSPALGKRAKWIYSALVIFYSAYISRFVYSIYLFVKGLFDWF